MKFEVDIGQHVLILMWNNLESMLESMLEIYMSNGKRELQHEFENPCSNILLGYEMWWYNWIRQFPLSCNYLIQVHAYLWHSMIMDRYSQYCNVFKFTDVEYNYSMQVG